MKGCHAIVTTMRSNPATALVIDGLRQAQKTPCMYMPQTHKGSAESGN